MVVLVLALVLALVFASLVKTRLKSFAATSKFILYMYSKYFEGFKFQMLQNFGQLYFPALFLSKTKIIQTFSKQRRFSQT